MHFVSAKVLDSFHSYDIGTANMMSLLLCDEWLLKVAQRYGNLMNIMQEGPTLKFLFLVCSDRSVHIRICAFVG